MVSNSVAIIPADAGGCAFYRVHQPIHKLAEDAGLNIGILPSGENMTHRVAADIISMNPRFLLIQRQFSSHQADFYQALKHTAPHIPLYMDFDDLLWNPHPRSTFKPTPHDIANLDRVARLADRLITSTKPLQEALWHRYKKKAVIVPNMIDEGLFRAPYRRNATEKMRILYAGSKTHQCDLDQIIPVVQNTHKKYEWHFVGYVPPEIRDIIRYNDGVSFPDYMNTLAGIKAHVGIAPLADIAFNKCKSNLKLLEYGVLGMATVASAVYPYNPSPALKIRTGSQNEWIAALRELEDEKTRITNAKKSQEYSGTFSIQGGGSLIMNAYN